MRVLRRINGLAWLLVAVCVVGAGFLYVDPSEARTSVFDVSAESALFAMMSDERRAAGVPRLIRDATLDELARQKALDMAQHGYFSHVSPRLGTVYDQLHGVDKNYKWAGENIARALSAATAHRGLMDSPDHRANILSSAYTHVGVGVVDHGGKKYVAQIFMTPR